MSESYIRAKVKTISQKHNGFKSFFWQKIASAGHGTEIDHNAETIKSGCFSAILTEGDSRPKSKRI